MTDSTSAVQSSKSGPLLWILGGCGCLLFGIGIIVAGIFFVVMKATEEPEKVVRSFLAASAAGDAERAYATFSPEVQQIQSLDEFRAVLASNPQLFDTTDVTWTKRSIENGTASFVGTAKARAGGEVPCNFSLRQYEGSWKILVWQLGGGGGS
ncbi:MAG: DUF4864 domain-containing protein [Acidobacteria bacterium]|nr:DUF4864 domain-containing protein [Acidobacteriota bacterium]